MSMITYSPSVIHPFQNQNFINLLKDIKQILLDSALKLTYLFTEKDVQNNNFRIKVIADITCDIKGSIPTTIRPSTIESPIYDIDSKELSERAFMTQIEDISVMAVDNLPCELPKDASESFGEQLISNVLPQFLGNDDGRIKNATLTNKNGEINKKYEYLEAWINS